MFNGKTRALPVSTRPKSWKWQLWKANCFVPQWAIPWLTDIQLQRQNVQFYTVKSFICTDRKFLSLSEKLHLCNPWICGSVVFVYDYKMCTYMYFQQHSIWKSSAQWNPQESVHHKNTMCSVLLYCQTISKEYSVLHGKTYPSNSIGE